jgi:hypothetical protein
MKERIPATPRPTASIKLKHLHKKFGQGQSLKDYVRNSLETDEDKQLANHQRVLVVPVVRRVRVARAANRRRRSKYNPDQTTNQNTG